MSYSNPAGIALSDHQRRQLATIEEDHDMIARTRGKPGCLPVTLVLALDADGLPRATCPACGKGWAVP